MPRIDPKSYRYVEKTFDESVLSGIMLLKPEKWKGFVFSFTGGHFGEPNQQGVVPVEYDFEILDNTPEISKEEIAGEEFTVLLGDIFVDICKQVY